MRPLPRVVSWILQRAGDRVVQIGQVFGNVRVYLVSLKTALAVVVLLLVLAGAIALAYSLSQRPARMAGDFNIAVAQFGEETDQGVVTTARANQISKLLFDFLDSEYRATDFGLKVEVAHDKIGVIVEARQAEQLAYDINADLVIYGRVFVVGNTATLSPRFYVKGGRETEELTGQHQLAVPLEFDVSSLSFEDIVNVQLRARTAILVSFTKGMTFLSARGYDAALRNFTSAIDEAERSGPYAGEEVLYVFAAVASEKQGRYDDANRYVDLALAHNPEYSRAFIARGKIYYAQALPTWDAGLLDQALAEYEKALQARDQPEGAFVREKVSVSLANIYLVRAQQTNDAILFDKAIASYQGVIEEYEAGRDERLRELTAIAYFGVGAVYERQSKYAQARQAYQQCARLTHDSELRSRADQQLEIIAKKSP